VPELAERILAAGAAAAAGIKTYDAWAFLKERLRRDADRATWAAGCTGSKSAKGPASVAHVLHADHVEWTRRAGDRQTLTLPGYSSVTLPLACPHEQTSPFARAPAEPSRDIGRGRGQSLGEPMDLDQPAYANNLFIPPALLRFSPARRGLSPARQGSLSVLRWIDRVG
jgi:hypothetical protein